MFVRGTSYTVAISLPVVVAAFVFAGPLIEAWLGEILLPAVEPTRLFLVYLTFVVFHIVGATMAIALGKLRFLLLVTTANLMVNFAISVRPRASIRRGGRHLGTLSRRRSPSHRFCWSS